MEDHALRIGVSTSLEQEHTPITDEAISPLRWRMIEDMTIRNFTPKTAAGLHPRRQDLRCISRPVPGQDLWRKAVEAFQHSHIEQKLGQIKGSTWPPRFPV
jgi:hypothetical protein